MGVGVVEAQGGVEADADPDTVPHPGHLSHLQAIKFRILNPLKNIIIRKILKNFEVTL